MPKLFKSIMLLITSIFITLMNAMFKLYWYCDQEIGSGALELI